VEQGKRTRISRIWYETMVLLSGIPHAELQAPTIWEMAPDGRWLLAEQDLAA
jgi:hypothetical protein